MFLDTVKGVVLRVTYSDPFNGFSVIKIRLQDESSVIITGKLPELFPGYLIECEGNWEVNSVYGKQFKTNAFSIEIPSQLHNLETYLGSGAVRGMGPSLARRVIEKFKESTDHVLSHEPDRLTSITGIGSKKSQLIHESWMKQKHICSIAVLLNSIGLPPSKASRILSIWPYTAEEMIRENPYELVRKINGIGFKLADRAAQKIGIPSDSILRIREGINFVIMEMESYGHTCHPINELYNKCSSILALDVSKIVEHVDYLINEKLLISSKIGEETFVWRTVIYDLEKAISNRLLRLANHQKFFREDRVEHSLKNIFSSKIEPDADQIKAVKMCFTEKTLVITGGPGTGKSTITNIIISIAKQLDTKIMLASPTGKAAKRLSEVSGVHAKTLHNMLEYNFKNRSFKRNRKNSLDVDLMIVDEVSMVDSWLFYSLIQALPDRSHLLLLGDTDQLASIGAGNILFDLIESGHIPVAKLSKIFRQAARSKIVYAAHQINKGVAPLFHSSPEDDFQFIQEDNDQAILTRLKDEVCNKIPSKTGYSVLEEVQVLSPMRKGLLGLENLNKELQEELCKGLPPFMIGGKRFFIGDKVIQMRNNYKKEVFNGEIGLVSFINQDEKIVTVKTLDGKITGYSFEELHELQLAYAISVHKYQGSESRCIVMPIHSSHAIILNKKVLYTAVTRARQLALLIGSKRDLWGCVKRESNSKRITGLTTAIKDCFFSHNLFCRQ